MGSLSLLGTIAGLGLASGISLYATILGVGLGIHFGFFQPRAELSHLQLLAHPYVLIPAGAAYLIEFLADKIPWVDSIWDSFHTFIRPLGAAILAAASLGSVSPEVKIGVAVLTGAIALTGHSAKAGTRLAVNQSPEPFSNIGLSLAEDVFVVFATWLSMEHPMVMFSVVAAFLVVFFWVFPKVFRLARVQWYALKGLLGRWSGTAAPADGGPIRCIAGSGIRGLRNSIGMLSIQAGTAVFTTRRTFRTRRHVIDLRAISDVELKKHLLTDSVCFRSDAGKHAFHFFKERSRPAERAFAALSGAEPVASTGSPGAA